MRRILIEIFYQFQREFEDFDRDFEYSDNPVEDPVGGDEGVTVCDTDGIDHNSIERC